MREGKEPHPTRENPVIERPNATSAVFGPLPEGTVSADGGLIPEAYAVRFLARDDASAAGPRTFDTGDACPRCGHVGFDWLSRHGEAACGECNYPLRNIHYFVLPDGERKGIRHPLWYRTEDEKNPGY